MKEEQGLQVLLMEPEENLRHFMCQLIDGTKGLACAGCLCSPLGLKRNIRLIKPNILLINLNAANELGYERLQDLKTSFPDLMIVLMDMEHGPRYRQLARQAGADTFMSTVSAPEELERLIRSYSALMA
ncbi:response regulator transcription factor [Dethiosulfatarculus sandiegensis]|uniref:Response regulatory domain-containing protein n=1 Tax=Dethiosulfatarculus sandiegensis TaxID=1429043 RepID=A0A0D2IYG0_9BACT|nr:response regulator transcription factor [Dethiosulfatarculus sandiegensis]KIX11029.1 hypothetical protein X474_27385 [Dethiosulfatarculus sandiegensis]